MTDLRQNINLSLFSRRIDRNYLEGIAPLRHWYVNPNERSNNNKSSVLNLTKALTEYFLQGNIPLRQLLNAKPQFIYWLLTEIWLQWSKWLEYALQIALECSSRRLIVVLNFVIQNWKKNFKRIWTIIRRRRATDSSQNQRQCNKL